MHNNVLKNGRISIGDPMLIEVLCDDISDYMENSGKDELTDDTREKALDDENIEHNDDAQPEEIISAEDMSESILEEAREKAKEIIENAKNQAHQIISQAREEAEAEKDRVFEETFKKAYDEGLTKAKEEYSGIISEAQKTRENAEEDYSRIISGMEADIVKLIIDTTQKVLLKEMSIGKDYILELVRQGVKKCRSSDDVVIKVSERDYEKVIENKEFIMTYAQGIDMVEIKKDISIKEGACLVETSCGAIDCSVDTKFNAIREAFHKILIGGKALERHIS